MTHHVLLLLLLFFFVFVQPAYCFWTLLEVKPCLQMFLEEPFGTDGATIFTGRMPFL